jgi:hypothetical protein
MMTSIAVTAGEIWLEIDRENGVFAEILLSRMGDKRRSRDLLLMALGWLVYEGHVRWTPVERGGRLFLTERKRKEDLSYEESDQNHFAVNGA